MEKTPFYWLSEDSLTTLSRGYLAEGIPRDKLREATISRVRQISDRAEEILKKPGFSNKLFDYISRGWVSPASPVWANFGLERGLPISCNNTHFDDTVASILLKTAEIGMMTKLGAGTSAYLGDLRPAGSPISGGGKSLGPIHFLRLPLTTTDVISQSNVRRGKCAYYLPIDSKDIWKFLEIGDDNTDNKKKKMHHVPLGVCITDEWMHTMMAEPAGSEKRKLWTRIIRKRYESGFPYLFFTDNANNQAPQVYKDKGMKIKSSNLCTEIMLASTTDESFVCDLSSVNLCLYDEWKNSDLIETMIYFLDAVMSEYIEKIQAMPADARILMQGALNFAVRWRALGLGTLGYHSYLQSKMIAFESAEARAFNIEAHKLIQERSMAASRQMAIEYGEPEGMKGYGMRNLTLNAIAPTVSSSFILGAGKISPSIEPFNSNYGDVDIAKGVFTVRNPFLGDLLEKYGKNTEETWLQILKSGGSVQGLDFLTEHDKNVFKTFGEISQLEIVIQAADRQKYIDQGQSLNFSIHPDTPLKETSQLIVTAWQLGLKSLYYHNSKNKAQEFARGLLSKNSESESSCLACEA